MSIQEQILSQVEALPPVLQQELLDFAIFLRIHKLGEKYESMLMSYSVLQDWSSPEEDEAWKDL